MIGLRRATQHREAIEIVRPLVMRGGFGIFDTLPLTYQFELLALNVSPYFQTGTISTLPVGSFPAGGCLC